MRRPKSKNVGVGKSGQRGRALTVWIAALVLFLFLLDLNQLLFEGLQDLLPLFLFLLIATHYGIQDLLSSVSAHVQAEGYLSPGHSTSPHTPTEKNKPKEYEEEVEEETAYQAASSHTRRKYRRAKPDVGTGQHSPLALNSRASMHWPRASTLDSEAWEGVGRSYIFVHLVV